MSVIVHATTVAIDGNGVLIIGAAGAGKSGLALELIAFGAQLVADDRTVISLANNELFASCPETLRGKIEARGLGILNVPTIAEARLCLCVDLDSHESERLPPRRTVTFLKRPLDLVRNNRHRHFPSAVLLYVRHGRWDKD